MAFGASFDAAGRDAAPLKEHISRYDIAFRDARPEAPPVKSGEAPRDSVVATAPRSARRHIFEGRGR